jgi:hypothetical protein
VQVDPRRVGRLTRLFAVLVPVPLAAVGLAGAIGGAIIVLVAVAALLVSLGALVVMAMAQVRPQPHELWIRYEGGALKVFVSREEWRVKQLARAVRRAMDAATEATRA